MNEILNRLLSTEKPQPELRRCKGSVFYILISPNKPPLITNKQLPSLDTFKEDFLFINIYPLGCYMAEHKQGEPYLNVTHEFRQDHNCTAYLTKSLQYALTNNNPAYAANVLNCILLDIQLMRSDFPAPPAYWKTRAMLSFLSFFYKETYTREAVAARLDVHPNYINRLFKTHVARSFKASVDYWRLIRAVELVRNTARSFIDIAEATGYGSAGYMSKIFQKSFKRSPRQLRQRKAPMSSLPELLPVSADDFYINWRDCLTVEPLQLLVVFNLTDSPIAIYWVDDKGHRHLHSHTDYIVTILTSPAHRFLIEAETKTALYICPKGDSEIKFT